MHDILSFTLFYSTMYYPFSSNRTKCSLTIQIILFYWITYDPFRNNTTIVWVNLIGARCRKRTQEQRDRNRYVCLDTINEHNTIQIFDLLRFIYPPVFLFHSPYRYNQSTADPQYSCEFFQRVNPPLCCGKVMHHGDWEDRVETLISKRQS